MGRPIQYPDDGSFLREMERLASIGKSPSNHCRVQKASLEHLIALAKKGAGL